jgi:hypothetical protein
MQHDAIDKNDILTYKVTKGTRAASPKPLARSNGFEFTALSKYIAYVL